MERLNKLLIEIEGLNKKIRDTEIFIAVKMEILKSAVPNLWAKYQKVQNKVNDKQKSTILNNLKSKNGLDNFRKKKCKELYRRISRITHPDKTINNLLNELFIIAKRHRDNNNLRALENIFEVVQNQLKEPGENFITNKLVELNKQIRDLKLKYNRIITSPEYSIAKLYDENKEKAERLFTDYIGNSIRFHINF
jgi:hypothetical protein